MNNVKRNKAKAWRKTYGKPFLIRRAIKIAQMVVIAAQGQAHRSAMIGYGVPASAVMAGKAVAFAQSAISTAKAMRDCSHEMNKGFVYK